MVISAKAKRTTAMMLCLVSGPRSSCQRRRTTEGCFLCSVGGRRPLPRFAMAGLYHSARIILWGLLAADAIGHHKFMHRIRVAMEGYFLKTGIANIKYAGLTGCDLTVVRSWVPRGIVRVYPHPERSIRLIHHRD